jgi:hypothetical protein
LPDWLPNYFAIPILPFSDYFKAGTVITYTPVGGTSNFDDFIFLEKQFWLLSGR